MKFLFDENIDRGLAKGLREFGEDVEHVLDHFVVGAKDVDILKFIGERKYFLVTKDRRIRYRPAEIAALKQFSVGAFFLVGKSMSYWEIVKQLIRSWEHIKEIAAKESTPFIYALRQSGKPEKYQIS